MNNNLPLTTIQLNENDIPGASFQGEVEKQSVQQLKRFLQCRGKKYTGKKTELVKRVKSCMDLNVPIDPAVVGGKWFDIKRTQINQKLPQDSINNFNYPKDWYTFPSGNLPLIFNYGCIYKYIVDECALINLEDSESTINIENFSELNSVDVSTSKPLTRGFNYFESGHVKDIKDSITNDGYYYMQCNVISSYHEKVKYQVHIRVNNLRGTVQHAKCNCKASAMGRCSHVAALLYALHDYLNVSSNEDNENVPCTSKLCTWNQGRRKKDPQKVDDYNSYQKKPKAKSSTSSSLYVKKVTKSSSVLKPMNEEKNTELLNNLKSNRFKYSERISGWEMLLSPLYEDYQLTPERKGILKQLTMSMLHNLTFDARSEPMDITRGLQQDSDDWKRLRQFFFTASTAKKYMTASESTLLNLIDNKIWNKKDFRSIYTDYGIENETNAIDCYKSLPQNKNVVVETTGLWINSKYPGFAASPDSLVYDKYGAKPFGLIEVKCPFILRDTKCTDLESLTKNQRYNFCCTLEDGKLSLKRHHEYYYQIQFQLLVTERDWCDFIIWTKSDISVERIYFNSSFAKEIIIKLREIYDNIFIPEYFEIRIPRKLKPFNLCD